jgi:ABC-type Zn uptake system ZnuABC Zn-binding protein ZnuA
MSAIKYQFTILLLLLCSVSALQSQPASQKPLVVTTASMFTDMAANIGGDLIEVASIVPIGGDPHIYEPTPGDVRLLLRANVILQNGLTFEGWIKELIQNSGAKASVHTLTEGIEPIVSTMHQNATDPHAWMEPVNGKIYALNIKNALVELMPQHAAQIDSQYDAYAAKLDELDAYIREQISKIDTSKRILITSHDSFHYYGKRYGMRLESVLGTSTDADVRTSDLMRLNQVIRDNKIPAVFIESTINPKLLEQVATDNKIRIGGKLYSDSLGDENSPANTYINMIKQNTDVIVSGLTSMNAETEPGNGSQSKRFPLLWLILGIVLFAIAGGIWWKKTQAS